MSSRTLGRRSIDQLSAARAGHTGPANPPGALTAEPTGRTITPTGPASGPAGPPGPGPVGASPPMPTPPPDPTVTFAAPAGRPAFDLPAGAGGGFDEELRRLLRSRLILI